MKGIVIKDFKLLPTPGYAAIAIFPFIFIRTNTQPWSVLKYRKYLMNHERIHLKQQLEMLIIPFYIWYVLEFGFRLIQYKGHVNSAYRNISFEREAFTNEKDLTYRDGREWFAWVKYLKKD